MAEFTIESEVNVNTYTSGEQNYSSVTGLSDGGWVVTWMSYGQDSSDFGIFQQRFAADGSAYGDEIQVNTTTNSGQEYPTITALSDGGWVVTWMSYGQDGSGYGVYQQRYDATGTADGSEVLVNTTTTNDQSYPAVQALADGGWVVSWGSYDSSSYASSLYQQRYDANGQANGGETLIATDTNNSYYYYNNTTRSSITDLPDGGWVVTWTTGGGYMSGSNNIYMQEFDSTGTAVGSTTTVASLYSYMHGVTAAPTITTLEDGGWVISWMDAYSGGVSLQRYDADGAASGSTTTISTGGYYYYGAGSTVVATSDGGWAVIWQAMSIADYTNDVYMQLFDSDGNSASDATLVHTVTTGEQIYPSVSALEDGRFVVTFTSENSNGDAYGIQQSIVTLAESTTVTLDEDASHSFAQSEFTFSVENGATLVSITVTALPANGTLTLDGETVTVGDTITAAELDTLVWVPDEDDNGTSVATLRFTSLDDSNVVKHGTVKFDVSAVNDDPTAADNTVTLTEDGSHTFTASDFGFSDIDGDSLGSVVISTLPSSGTLELNGVAVTSGQEITAADIGSLVWTPDADDAGTAVDSLTFAVKDGQGGTSDAHTLTFDVAGVADDPTAADNTITIDEDESYTFSAADFGFSDVDGDTLASVTIGTIPSTGSLTLNGNAVQADDVVAAADIGNLVWTPDADVSGNAYDTLTFTVQDSSTGSSTTHTITFDIDPVNDAPTSADNTVSLTEDGSYTFSAADFDCSDPVEGDTLVSVTITELPSSGSLKLDGVAVVADDVIALADLGDLVWTPDANDSGSALDTLKFKVTDSGGATSANAHTITFDVTGVNDDPTVANAIADQNGTAGTAFTFAVVSDAFRDVDAGDTLTYTATLASTDGLPSWLTFDAATRTFSASPDVTDTGTFSIKVIATDGSNASVFDTFDIVIGDPNNAPTVATAIGDHTATEDTAFSFQVPANTFDDIDPSDTLTYTATLSNGDDLPSWLTFDATTGTFSGTPEQDDVGTISVKVIATDGSNASASDTFDIVIGDANDTPTVENAISNQTATEDTAFSFQFAASTFDDTDSGDSLTYTASLADGGGLPSWLTFDATTRTFSGTPDNDDVGIISVRVTATDESSASVSDTFDITIANVNDAPTAEANILDVAEDSSHSFSAADFGFADIEDDTLASITITALPLSGSLTLDGEEVIADQVIAASAIGDLVWTPDANANGDALASLSFKVTDSGGATSASAYTITFDVTAVNDAPTAANDTITIDEDGAYTFSASDFGFSDTIDDGDTLASITITALPLSGSLTLDGEAVIADQVIMAAAIGNLTWTPDADANGDALASLSFKVTDSGGATSVSANTITIDVNAVNDAPTVSRDTASLKEGKSVTVDVLANDTDIDGDVLSVQSAKVTSGNGKVTVDSDGKLIVTYTGADLDKGENAKIVVTYQATDGLEASKGVLTVKVNGVGDAGHDLQGTPKNDRLIGTEWGERIFGFAGDDVIKSGGGDDVIAGSSGNDRIWAGTGNDRIGAGGGNDFVDAGSGDDEIMGWGGNDRLWGGSGADTFVFHYGDGRDIIGDFQTAGSDHDTIDLRLFEGKTSFQDIKSSAHAQGKDLVLEVTGGVQITLKGVELSELSTDHFLF